MKIFLIVTTFFLGLSAHASDFDLLRQRFKEDIQLDKKTAETFFVKEIREWSSSLGAGGTWKDIDYNLDDNKFTPGEHPRRMDFMARAYTSPGHPQYKDQAMLKAILKAYDAWLIKDVQSYNWWHNTIGIPQRFARTMLLLEDELGERRIRKALFILERARISKTGQNRLWYSELTAIRGAFKENSREVKEGASEIYKVMDFANAASQGEGIQKDYSFHQHGPLIYNGGYGSKYSRDMARLVAIFAGTDYAFPKSKIDMLSSYILDGQIWMTRGDKWDYSVTGREISRKGKSAEKLIEACGLLKERPVARKKEFGLCYDSLTKNRPYLEGNKNFPDSDYMAHHSKKIFYSARMYSMRTLNNDAPSNSEGLLSHHLADGATFIMRDGSEYEDVFPAWDWRHIPGTTVEKKRLKPAVYEPGNWGGFAHIRFLGRTSFAGGVSDGKSGVASFDFKHNLIYEKVDAYKSWFFDDDKMIALGSDISCVRRCEKIVTTVDQKNANGEVFILTQNGELKKHNGSRTYENLLGVFHDKIGYFFSQGQEVTIELGPKSGNWARINGQYSADEVTKSVFNLFISHERNNTYAYEVAPLDSLEDFKSYQINDHKVAQRNYHAVKMGDKIMISSKKSGQFDFWGVDFGFGGPTTMILDLKSGAAHASDPTQNFRTMEIKIEGSSYLNRLPKNGRPVIFQTGL